MSWGLTLSDLAPEMRNGPKVDEALKRGTYVGIDFGTANTVASIIARQGDSIVSETIDLSQESEDGRTLSHHLLPSVIAYHKERLLIGAGAKSLKSKLVKGKNIWFEFKMDLGVDQGPSYYSTVLPKSKGSLYIERPVDAALVLLDYLRRQIEAHVDKNRLPRPIHYCVSIPASFETNQRRDLLEALKGAKLNVGEQALIDEPNAAFLSCVNDLDTRSTASFQVPKDTPMHALIFDFGAGTCDISILELGRVDQQFYSKNIAISRFTALGGNEIDRAIIRQVLLKELKSEEGVDIDSVSVADMEKRVVPRLEDTAEVLKIKACKELRRQMVGFRLPKNLGASEETVTLGKPVGLSTTKGTFTLENPRMSFLQFSQVMTDFTDANSAEDGKSVFEPIHSALRKADLDLQSLDLIILIGGSSLNPYVQCALSEHFPKTEMVLPRDPRAHVSAGAALHCFLLNGLGHNLIQPITSEPILALARGGEEVLLLPAGSSIPCNAAKVPNLVVADEGQKVIEIPICVTSPDKVVGLIQISSAQAYPKGTAVSIDCSVSEDKLLVVSATVKGKRQEVSFSNPFANRALTIREQEFCRAQKAANESAASNLGRPSYQALYDLGMAYAGVKKHLEAAETLEKALQMNPNAYLATDILCQYDKAGRTELANQWARRAYDVSPDSVTAYNLATKFPRGSPDFCRLMEEGLDDDPDATYILANYGETLAERGDPRGAEMLEKAYQLFQARHEDDPGGLDRLDCYQWWNISRRLRRHQGEELAMQCLIALEHNPGLYSSERLLASGDDILRGMNR